MQKDFTPSVRVRVCAFGLGFFIIAGTLWLSGCTSPQNIATFAGTAQSALEQGPAIFRDLHGSCLRRHSDADPITALYLPPPPGTATPNVANENPVCTPLAPQGDALTKASDVLAAYFRAMQQLASFNTSTVSAANQQAAENAAVGAQLPLNQVDSLGKLAGFITDAFTGHYQRSRLAQYLRQADPSISSVTRGFEEIVSEDYGGLLREERQTFTARYQNIGDSGSSATILLLNRAYTDDLKELDRRKAVADAYVQALQEIRAGHHQLALSADRLNTRDLSLALLPYTAKLQALVPVLQKGF